MCFKIVQKKLILKMRGNHLKSSKKFLGFFLKKNVLSFKKLQEIERICGGNSSKNMKNIFFLQWLR